MQDPGQGGQQERLSRTMRIDIAPDALNEPAGPAAPAAKSKRIITRRARSRIDQKLSEPAELGHAQIGSDDFQELLQGVYDAALITDMNGRIVDGNVRAIQFFLYETDELLKLSVLDIVSGSDESLVTKIRENLVERFVLIEACYCARKDGTFFPAEIAVNQLPLSGQDFLCFFVRDVTLRRQAEEKLRVEHNAIQNSRSGILITDLDAKIVYTNPAVSAMWNHGDSSDFVGRHVSSLWEPQAQDSNLLQSVIDEDETWIREFVATRGDGSQFSVQVTAACNTDADGELTGMVFSLVDISDQKRADEAERDAERHRVMLESLGAACHHLGQPATVLLANLGIMKRHSTKTDEKIQELVGSCLEAAESLSTTLHKLNATNEYRTTPYLDGRTASGKESRILDI